MYLVKKNGLQILAVDCNTPSNINQYNGHNGEVLNSWTNSPSVPQEMTNHYNTDTINSYPPPSTYLNNNPNQQHNNYEQYSPVPQMYDNSHNLNFPQQSTTPQQPIFQEKNYLQPVLQDQLNSNSEPVNQQLTNMQYSKFNQDVSNSFKQPVIDQKNQQSQSEQGVLQSFGTIESSPPKEHHNQSPTHLNYPIPDEKLPDFGQLPDFGKLTDVGKTPDLGQVKTNTENTENKPVQDPSKIVPQLSQQTSFDSTSKLPQISSEGSSKPLNDVYSTPNENTMNIKQEALNPQSNFPGGKIGQPTENQSELVNSLASTMSTLHQIQPPQISSQDSSTPNQNIIQNKNNDMPLNSLSSFPDGKPEPLISNSSQNKNILIDNSLTDLHTFLYPENNNNLNPLNNVSDNQDNSKLELNDTPPQLQKDNTQVENDPQQGDLINDIDLDDDSQKSQIPLNESPLPVNVVDTQLNEELVLEKAMSESPVFPFYTVNGKNQLHSIENLEFDESLENGLSKFAKSDPVNTENLENSNQDKPKLSVFANPNDIHILQIPPVQTPTSDNSNSNNNYLLNLPPAVIPWYKPPFPNIVDYYTQQSALNNQLPSSLLNSYQNPSFYSQIPMYPINNYNFNQQDAYSTVGQNQMTSNIQFPDLSQNVNQPSSKDNTGCIYKKVDLKNPPPDSTNSWLLLNKDYTRNSNQNNGYTSYDGITRTSIFGTPSTSFQNNMMPMNSLNVPLGWTKAIFDVTRANFPRAPLSQIVRLTEAVVQSVMHSFQLTMNTVMNTLYVSCSPNFKKKS